MTSVAPAHLRVWENFNASQKKGLRRYRRIAPQQDEHGGKDPRPGSQPRHWAHPEKHLPLRYIESGSQEVPEIATADLSITALVQQKSSVLHPMRKCMKQRLKEEADTLQCVLLQSFWSLRCNDPFCA